MTSPTDEATLRHAMLALARSRGPDKTFCPSEVARGLSDDWRPLMAPAREVARKLARECRLRVLQRGQVVAPDENWRGPIRLQWRAPPDGR